MSTPIPQWKHDDGGETTADPLGDGCRGLFLAERPQRPTSEEHPGKAANGLHSPSTPKVPPTPKAGAHWKWSTRGTRTTGSRPSRASEGNARPEQGCHRRRSPPPISRSPDTRNGRDERRKRRISFPTTAQRPRYQQECPTMMNEPRRRVTEFVANRLEVGAALLRSYGRRARGGGRTLVLGGVRSGKSRHAEELMSGYRYVTYVAGSAPPTGDDPEWAARVAAHRARRPAHWRTIETLDIAGTLRQVTSPVLIDCLGTWLARVLGEVGAWEQRPGWQRAVDERLQDFVDAWQTTTVPVVAVSNEVGSGVVPATHSGRVFRDVLGALNTAVAAGADSVRLVVAGRVVHL